MGRNIFPSGGATGETPAAGMALISVIGLDFSVLVESIRGAGGASTQITQDFAGTPFFVLFGKRVSTMDVVCSDARLLGCDGTKKISEAQQAMNSLRTHIENGALPAVTISSSSGTAGSLIKGFLTAVDVRMQRPEPKYILTIVGTMGG